MKKLLVLLMVIGIVAAVVKVMNVETHASDG